MTETEISLPNQFSALGDFLSNFIEALPDSAHVKDSKTGKYVLSNQTNLEFYGIKSVNDLVGLTVHDLDQFMNSRWGNKFAKTVDALDYEVYANRHRVNDKRVVLTKNGFIRLQNMIKIPVIGMNGSVTGVFTLSYDLTKDIDLFQLYEYYKQYYSKNEAIDKFLNYLNLDQFFHENPTDAEILVLLTMRIDNSYKWSANKLGIRVKTVEIHSGHIRNKLKGISLHQLLGYIRNHGKF